MASRSTRLNPWPLGAEIPPYEETSLPADVWTIIGSVSAAASAAATAVGFIWVRRQLAVANRSIAEDRRQLLQSQAATELQGYMALIDYLQTTEALECRGIVLAAHGRSDFPATQEEVEAAKDVCRRYQTVAILVERQVMPEQLWAKYWRDSITKCFRTLKGWILSERARMHAPGYADAFQNLAERLLK